MCTTIEPPVRSIPLPGEVADLLSDAQARGMTGVITLHFANGVIGAIEYKRQLGGRRTLTSKPQRA